MKKVVLLVCLMSAIGVVCAQDEVSFSEEELTKYASVMVWAEMEKTNMTKVYNGWINNDDALEAARFVKIKSANGDEVKLQEIGATTEEVAAFTTIQTSYDSMTSAFKEVYVGKIKEEIGAGLYNQLKKSMKSNGEIKAQYQMVYDRLKEEAVAEDSSDELKD